MTVQIGCVRAWHPLECVCSVCAIEFFLMGLGPIVSTGSGLLLTSSVLSLYTGPTTICKRYRPSSPLLASAPARCERRPARAFSARNVRCNCRCSARDSWESLSPILSLLPNERMEHVSSVYKPSSLMARSKSNSHNNIMCIMRLSS